MKPSRRRMVLCGGVDRGAGGVEASMEVAERREHMDILMSLFEDGVPMTTKEILSHLSPEDLVRYVNCICMYSTYVWY